MTTLAERWLEEGRETGRDEKRREIVLKLLKKDIMSLEEIAALVELSVSEVKQIAQQSTNLD